MSIKITPLKTIFTIIVVLVLFVFIEGSNRCDFGPCYPIFGTVGSLIGGTIFYMIWSSFQKGK